MHHSTLPFVRAAIPAANKGRRGAIYRSVTAARDLVQRAQGQTATGQTRVDSGDSERKHRFDALALAFESLDLCA